MFLEGPIVLLLLCYVLKQAFKLQTFEFEKEEGDIDKYIEKYSVSYVDLATSETPEPNKVYAGMSILPILKICSSSNSKHTERPIIATVGNFPESIKKKIIDESKPYKSSLKLNIIFKQFTNVDELNNYVKDRKYGQKDYPLICFGMKVEKNEKKYDYSLHFFDSSFAQGVQDIPNSKDGLFDPFKSGPNLSSFQSYQTSGYIYIMKLINEYILQQEKGQSAKINLGMVAYHIQIIEMIALVEFLDIYFLFL